MQDTEVISPSCSQLTSSWSDQHQSPNNHIHSSKLGGLFKTKLSYTDLSFSTAALTTLLPAKLGYAMCLYLFHYIFFTIHIYIYIYIYICTHTQVILYTYCIITLYFVCSVMDTAHHTVKLQFKRVWVHVVGQLGQLEHHTGKAADTTPLLQQLWSLPHQNTPAASGSAFTRQASNRPA